jgi:hypothetical protein
LAAYHGDIHPDAEAEAAPLLRGTRETRKNLGRVYYEIKQVVNSGLPTWLIPSATYLGFTLYAFHIGRIIAVFGIKNAQLIVLCLREGRGTPGTTEMEARVAAAVNVAKGRLETS